jgi:hypothetical protein
VCGTVCLKIDFRSLVHSSNQLKASPYPSFPIRCTVLRTGSGFTCRNRIDATKPINTPLTKPINTPLCAEGLKSGAASLNQGQRRGRGCYPNPCSDQIRLTHHKHTHTHSDTYTSESGRKQENIVVCKRGRQDLAMHHFASQARSTQPLMTHLVGV